MFTKTSIAERQSALHCREYTIAAPGGNSDTDPPMVPPKGKA